MANQVNPLRYEYCDNRRLVQSRSVESIMVLTLLPQFRFLTLSVTIVLTCTLL